MDERRQQIIQEWQESARDTTERLQSFIHRLDVYAQADSVSQDAVSTLFRPLNNAGLNKWMDDNPAGGGIDMLGAALTGQPLPEPEPMTEASMIEAIFGKPAKEQPL